MGKNIEAVVIFKLLGNQTIAENHNDALYPEEVNLPIDQKALS
jgi:hypothetical protein